MANVLEKIVADKRLEVAERKQSLPLSSFKDSLTASEKSLFDALSEPNAGFIFECKKASPSKGLIRPVFDLDEILAAYTPYAAGISVLTDEKYFQGTYEYLQYVTSRVNQPVLNKDFFVDEYQVYLARHYNADAILLMLSVLDDAEYQQLAALANELQLDILTEVSNEEEMHRAIALQAKIIGINNRNLRDLSTDLATTEQLVPLLKAATHEFVVISESGIYTHADVLRLAPLCQGFLVGSALMAQTDVSKAVKTLVYGAVKVCGITSSQDAKSAVDAGASYLGLIFAEKSPRCVSIAQAEVIATQCPASYVGVFVNHPIDAVVDIAAKLNLTAVQLHGEEDHQYRSSLVQQLPENCELWQALGIKDELPASLSALIDEPSVSRVLLDCQVGTQKGGTGQQFDWSLLSNVADKHKVVLAGGITSDTIAQASTTGAGIIDINSGVEDAPGRKSASKLATAFAACRRY